MKGVNVRIMKKIFRVLQLPILAAALLCFTACEDQPALNEVAGRYEMKSISGTFNGVPIDNDSYSYYRLILDEQGNGIVQSKSAETDASAFEAKGTYTFENGKIKMNVNVGGEPVTEMYDYSDGKIIYVLSSDAAKFTIIMERSAGQAATSRVS